MNMIEKMARSIRRSILMKSNEVAKLAGIHSKVLSEEEMDKKIDELWHIDASEAKAALECLKEPTEGMLDARLYGLNHDVEYEQRKDLRPAIFKAMINAALEGK